MQKKNVTNYLSYRMRYAKKNVTNYLSYKTEIFIDGSFKH